MVETKVEDNNKSNVCQNSSKLIFKRTILPFTNWKSNEFYNSEINFCHAAILHRVIDKKTVEIRQVKEFQQNKAKFRRILNVN